MVPPTRYTSRERGRFPGFRPEMRSDQGLPAGPRRTKPTLCDLESYIFMYVVIVRVGRFVTSFLIGSVTSWCGGENR